MKLPFEHIPVFFADSVIFVTADRNINTAGEILHIGPLVDKGELHMDRSVKIIEEIAVTLKNLRFIICLCKLVVNVEELHRLGVIIAAHTADTVPVHFLIGNTLLDRLRGVRFQPGKKAGLFLRPGRGLSDKSDF